MKSWSGFIGKRLFKKAGVPFWEGPIEGFQYLMVYIGNPVYVNPNIGLGLKFYRSGRLQALYGEDEKSLQSPLTRNDIGYKRTYYDSGQFHFLST